MDDVDHHSQVGDALALLINGLAPFVDRTFAEVLPAELPWTEVLRRKDALAGKRGGVYTERDLSLLLRAMTERLGDLGYPFSRSVSRQGQNYASELRQIRNQWAHNQHFSAASAFRALDSAELLLREVGAQSQAGEVALLKSGLLPAPAPALQADPSVDEPEPEAAAGGTAPQLPAAGNAAGPQITVGALPVLSYAMAHCRVLVIDEVAVAHAGPDVRGATLEIDVVCAGGSLGGPKVLLLDLADGQTTTLRTIDLVLDPGRMLAVEEQQPGRVVATLRDAAGAALATVSSDVEVLAASQWMAEPVQLAMEMLAAHVQPNSAAVAPLLVEASDRLRSITGDSSLNGYQSESPERVDAIVQSVYEAMSARDIRYAEPPASWGDTGQKVRTPYEVLVGRLGTCLDTTVTLAAALEHAGINSTLWLLKGHSFIGYWRVDSSLPAVTSVDPDEIVNLVDLGHIALVETTMLAGGADAAPFADATRSPRRRLEDGLANVLGVTDIRQARLAKIFPLPSRSTGPDGQLVVSVYEAGSGPVIAPYLGGASPNRTADEREVEPPRVARWKNALLDLSLRNKLINYTDRSGFHLEVPGTAIHRLEDQVNANTPITLVASDAVSSVDAARGIRFGRDLPERDREVMLADKRAAFVDITSASYKAKLRYLAYKAKTIVEETGSNNLYLAFGMLRWRFAERDLRSPLILVPVTLSTTSRGETYRLTIDESGASTPNYCLLEKLRVSFGLDVPALENPAEDASGIDLAAAFGALREAVVRAGLPFRVDETVDLAILQFAKFPLWKDLDEHWRTLSTNPLVRHLIYSPLEPFVDAVEPGTAVDLDELGALVPVPADSSQLEAVHDAVEGQTFVLEGPPGTGKSQTITNLLARSVASGRRVLFVAEKRAALDVVKKRLCEVGLAELSLDLHDKGARPAAVRGQIRAALELQVRADADAMKSGIETVDASRRRLSIYAERLHETNGVGHSLYSARAFDLASDHSVPPMNVPPALVASGTAEQVDEIRTALRRVPEYADLARPRRQHPWRFLEERATPVDTEAVSTAGRLLDDALTRIEATGASVVDLLQSITSPKESEAWARLASAPRHPIDTIDALHSPAWRSHLDALHHDLDALAADASVWRQSVSAEVMDRDVPSLHQASLAADASGFFGRKKRRRAVLAQFADLLRVPAAAVDVKTLSTLTADMASTFARVSAARNAARQVPIPLVDPSWNPAVHEQAARVRDEIAWLTWTGDVLVADGTPRRDALRTYYATSQRGALNAELSALAAAWAALTRTGAIDESLAGDWAETSGFLATWWQTRAERNVGTSTVLQRWLDLIRAVEPLRIHGLTSAREALLNGDLTG
ncbi:DUF4011 domain-containing protein [Cellulomonas sp. URHE0023]|uniref:DUF4011 domain-containing protein n=1 Tax=Cellulomonas sp. URHE0023 TaxID=1380354 RepID=UPI000A5A1D28|nr:DUF4011 domain-containing protein [Cellulomonas sp. URHE0023]